MASGPNWPTRAIADLLGSGHRDRDAAASGLWPALVAGLLRSVAQMMNLAVGIPDHTRLSRRSAAMPLALDLSGARGPMQAVIDSTGLKVCGAGEWRRETYGGRGWRKLHLAVDPDSGQILASDLTDKDGGEPSRVGALLDQITGDIASVTAEGADDGEPVYRAVVIPPRVTARPSTQASMPRDCHLQNDQAPRPPRLAAGHRLWTPVPG